MLHSKKYYIMDAEAYERMKRDLPPETDAPLKEFNQSFIENKKLATNIENAEWSNLGSKIAPIISKGVSEVSTPQISKVDVDEEMMTLLEKAMGKKYQNKGIKMYQLLKKLPGVTITLDEIFADGKKILGNPVAIISNLVKNNALMAYDCDILLEKALSAGHESLMKKLVENREAKQIIADLMEAIQYSNSIQPNLITSTPKPTDSLSLLKTPKSTGKLMTPKSQRKRKSKKNEVDTMEGDETLMNESSDDDESFTDAPLADSIRGSNKRKRVKWLSLFTKNGGKK